MLDPGLRVMLALVVAAGWLALVLELGLGETEAFIGAVLVCLWVIYKTSSFAWYWEHVDVHDPRWLVPRDASVNRTNRLQNDAETGRSAPPRKGLMRFERP